MPYVSASIPSRRRGAIRLPLAAVFLCAAQAASAELVLSFYLGANESPDSTVDYDFNQGGGARSTSVSWDGEAFKMPPYFGLRATWWFDAHPNWGVAVDNVHAKIAANPLPEGFSALEFTDGVNMVTGNIQYRWLNDGRFTPYAGLGVGFTTPHTEVRNASGSRDTFWYQFGGPAAQVLAGVDYRIDDRWSVFAEVKYARFWFDVDLQYGGSLASDVSSRQAAVGVSYRLGR